MNCYKMYNLKTFQMNEIDYDNTNGYSHIIFCFIRGVGIYCVYIISNIYT